METDVLIIGSGIAGLSLALKLNELNPELLISIVTKSEIHESNTLYAQGGIAAVLNQTNDSFDNHIKDTLACGQGLCDEAIVEMVVKQAPERINELNELQVNFDFSSEKKMHLALEGGHSIPRIVHHKDKTGFEIESKLIKEISHRKNIQVLEKTMVVDLLIKKRKEQLFCDGASVYQSTTCQLGNISATVTVMASGGCGQVYLNSTNPKVATGDGYAIAHRAGAVLKNMQFMQFHPTALYQKEKSHSSFLISEALRGFGAYVVDKQESRFLFRYDKRGELATRDILSSAIMDHLKVTESECVYMDLRHIDTCLCEKEFPSITSKLKELGYTIKKDLIPIVPSAHYQCGGIEVNADGQTNISAFYAIGEVSCTGLHGANRLASNSLLEALVFSHNAAISIASCLKSPQKNTPKSYSIEVANSHKIPVNKYLQDIKERMSLLAFSDDKDKIKKAIFYFKQVLIMIEEELYSGCCSCELLDLRSIGQTSVLILKDKLLNDNFLKKN